ncbi:hyaluronidasehyaluronidase-3 [Octopus vulgaris]|uniref:Hyaluronidase n=1 Tax=Octopus vulgaris TaxID=6645 RepID=A0AA36BAX0_OCTVU|nr:hyaluronidasehyaluronidase-3 [Octopus vulgaris]
MFSLNLVWILCVIFISPGTSLSEKLFGRAFAVIWNAPSEVCERHHGIKFNFDHYNIIQNTGDHFQGDKMVIFYEKQLGLYPFISPNGTHVNGGIPQLHNLKEHLKQTKLDVEKVIPSKNFKGPAVIDWENWRPLYERNFGDKRIYKKLAIADVQKQHPSWNVAEVNFDAEIQFDEAARKLMSSTLELGEKLRSEGRWGFYGFPRIYQKIPEQTRIANDRLGWLFSLSSALYPSIYLHSKNDTWLKHFHFVVNTLNETFRIYDKFSFKNKTFVVPYVRFRYEHPEVLFTKAELLLSMTIPAATGSAGVIIWDSSFSYRNREHCKTLKNYVTTTLGPFIKKLTETFQYCSEHLCNGNGRCVKSWGTIGDSTYWRNSKGEFNTFEDLKLNEFDRRELKTLLNIVNNATESHLLKREIKDMFTCKCYTKWTGKHCDNRRP